MNDQMVLGVFGSRTLTDERVRILILEAIDDYRPDMLCTALEPGGVCEIARLIAREQGIPMITVSLNFRYRRGAFERRSKHLFSFMSHCIIIHDGISQGTRNERILAGKMEIPNTYTVLEPAKHDKSVGFEIKQEWDGMELEIIPFMGEGENSDKK